MTDQSNSFDVTDLADHGIKLCRKGLWEQGLSCLTRVMKMEKDENRLSTVFAFYGLGLAFHDSRIKEGLTYCQKALELGMHEPENYLSLARVHLLNDDRGSAFEVVSRGLELMPDHPGLLALRRRFGMRKKPVIPFLSRGNILNRLLGQFRHSLLKSRARSKQTGNPATARKPNKRPKR